MESISSTLKQLRLSNNMTIASICRSIAIERRTYYNYEEGEVIPSLKKIIALADLYNVSLDYICGRNQCLETEKILHISRLVSENNIDINEIEIIIQSLGRIARSHH